MKEIFELFVCKDEMIGLAKPFIVDDFTVATNKYNMIWKVGRDESATGTPGEGIINSCRNFISLTPKLNRTFTLEILQKALAAAPKVEEFTTKGENVFCKECNGEGEVEYEYSATTTSKGFTKEFDCPVCDGSGYSEQERKVPTGNMIPDLKSDLLIYGIPYAMNVVSLMVNVMNLLSSEAVFASINEKKQMYWQCGEYNFLSMGLFEAENPVYKIN